MRIFTSPKQLRRSKKPLIVTVGTFDGVHRGHLKVLKSLRDTARRERGTSCVITFKSHPQEVFHPGRRPQLLSSTLHKLALMDRAGIDRCLLLDFTKKFSRQTAEEFVSDYLVKELRADEVHLGYRAHFGFGKTGNVALMRKLARRYGFRFKEVGAFSDQGLPLSSTLIRDLIHRGDLREASRFLGRPFSLLGVIVHGKRIGHRLGFPTANLDVRSELLPPNGVYAVTVNILKLKDWSLKHGLKLDATPERSGLKGMLNLGYRPTVEKRSHHLVPEVHLFDFHKNLYGRVLEVVFHGWLRREAKYGSLEALKAQISRDQIKTQKILAHI